ncbi:hypothetical protein SCHPADRAFT_839742 [Schizopora paradoxa]|uniref:Tc1-like transposase DDE domain-containing protein n=1 Tax=Schizopora paradoxa TaxID=27342 RepID=A0A0H2R1C7_9AGAM|nr:hypothetical protein SCHPADRAFT_839742 [Schizopora paradoxa]
MLLRTALLATLEDQGLQHDEIVFAQDNKAKKWFDNNRVRLLPWPVQSPYMNIIENA